MRNIVAVLFFICFTISALPCLFLSAPPVEDALGTMAAAAYISGVDYRQFLAADGYFYKYGQAVMYLPVFLCVKDPVLRYKVMLMMNSALDALIPVIAFRIGTGYLKLDKRVAAGFALISSLMPSALLYSKYTWAEPVLFLVPWTVLLLLLKLAAADDSHGVKRRLSAYLAWVSAYAFMSHQRGIVIILAVVLTILILRTLCKKETVDASIFTVNLIAALAVDRLCNYWLRQVVYLGVKPKHNTLAAFLRPEIYIKLFSLQGFKVTMRTLLGWLYNLGVSGLGVTLVGLIAALLVTISVLSHRNMKQSSSECVMGLFVSLYFLGELSLGMLFFFETMYGYWDGSMIERCDHLVFGRYIESIYPLLFYLGIFNIYTSDKKEGLRRCIISLAAMVVLTIYYAYRLAPAMEGVDSYVHSLMSMNFSFDMAGVTTTRDVISNLPTALILFGVVACILAAVLFLLMLSGRARQAIVLALIVFLYIYIRSFGDIIYRVDAMRMTEYAKIYLGS